MKKCNVFSTASLLGKKWTLPLLQEISLHGGKGFNFVFRRMRKISPKILSKRLKDLENKGIISKKTIANARPIKTEYSLTDRGREVYGIFTSIKQWNAKYPSESPDCHSKECVSCEKY